MRTEFKIYLFIAISFFLEKPLSAQLLVNTGNYHNQFFIGSGYHDSFGSATYGFNHTKYFKRIKKNITGILDFSTPLSPNFYTRLIFRKGFQFDCLKKNDFKLPLSIITSSVKKHLHLFSVHDLITDVSLLPGVYKKHYTFAAELSVKVLWRHKTHRDPLYFDQYNINSNPKLHRLNFSIGLVAAYNIKHFSLIIRSGFQQINDFEINKYPFYAFGVLAYNLNFKKAKSTEASREIKQ
jgi:hypothetical protein